MSAAYISNLSSKVPEHLNQARIHIGNASREWATERRYLNARAERAERELHALRARIADALDWAALKLADGGSSPEHILEMAREAVEKERAATDDLFAHA